MPGPCISFDIGSKNVQAVLGQADGTKVKILKSVNIDLPKGVITDGLIANKEGLIPLIQEAVSGLHTSVKDAVITFNSNSVIIREFEVPAGDPKEVEAMIKNEIIQYFGMTDTDLVEYRKIADIEANGLKKVKVRAAVMNREIAQAYYELLNSLNLKPLALDIHPNAVSKIFPGQTAINGDYPDSYILLDIGYSGTMIYLFSQGSLNFFRFVSFGGKAVDRLLSGGFSLTEENVEAKKLELLSAGGNPEKNEGVAAVKPLYGELLEELRKVMQYFLNRSGMKELNQIYLMGGGAAMAGLPGYLSLGLGFEVNPLQSLGSVQIKDNDRTLGTLVNAAGAIIRL